MEYKWLKSYEHFKIDEDDHNVYVKYKGIIVGTYSSSGVREETLKKDVEEWNNNIGELERIVNSKN